VVLSAGKKYVFLRTLEARFLATDRLSGAFQYASKECPAKFYGLEYRGWAGVGSGS